MIESLKLKLMNVLTIDGGTPKLSSLDGLVVEGYSTEVSSLGRIVKMTKDTNTESYFVDDKFNISQLGANISTGTTSASESTVINNIDLVLLNIGRTVITVTVNADIESGSSIQGYMYLINGEVINVGTSNTYTYQSLTQETTYDIGVIVVDNKGKTKAKNITGATNAAATARYLILEVSDHFAGNSAAINELQIYDQANNLLTYQYLNAYDLVNNSKPNYWDSTVWKKENSYDGQTAYGSNSEGGANCTLFLYSSGGNTGYWARALIDLESEKIVNSIKISVGGADSRTPKNINIYVVNNYSASTYTNNVAQRNDTGLFLLGTKAFTGVLSTPAYSDLY